MESLPRRSRDRGRRCVDAIHTQLVKRKESSPGKKDHANHDRPFTPSYCSPYVEPVG
jgi:hypothetical protein